MSSLPAVNPCVPLLSYIPGGVNVGSRLVIRGLMPYSGDRFTVDLQCGSQPMQDDIAFHISIRPSEYVVVRNSFQCYSWGPEERYGSCPVQRGHPYEIEIYTEYNRFSVRVNGSHVFDFHHRVPIQRISHIRVAGDTTLYYVGNEGHHGHGVYPPQPCPPVIISPQPTVVVAPPPSRRPPLIGAAVVGGLIGAAAASIGRPGHHHHHHHGWGGGHHHHHRHF